MFWCFWAGGYFLSFCLDYFIFRQKRSSAPTSNLSRLRSLIAAAGLPVEPPAIAADDWMRAMGMDKKVQKKQLRFVLLRSLGNAYVTASYDAERRKQIVGSGA